MTQPALLVVCLGQKNSKAKEGRPKVISAWKTPGTHHGRGEVLLLCVTQVDFGFNSCKPMSATRKVKKRTWQTSSQVLSHRRLLVPCFFMVSGVFHKSFSPPLWVRRRHTKISM